VECRVGCREDERLRLSLVVVAAEVMNLILLDRAAEGPAQLLVRVGDYMLRDEIGRIQAVITKVAGEGSRRRVRARSRDGIHLDAARASLGGIEAVRDIFELADGIAAEVRLPEADHQRAGDLLAIDIDLIGSIPPRQRIIARIAGARVRPGP